MANKLINQMGLPKSIANIFTARNIITAKDALSHTEFELMELLDVGKEEVTSAMAHVSEVALLLLEQRVRNETLAGHLPTRLKGLDDALCGGIPFGVLTELVGPAGIGKTQFCLKLSLLASLPASCGGLDGRVIYIDIESKFRSKRLIEIGINSFPEIFHKKGMAQEMAGRILILRPTSLSEFAERSLAEFSRIPVVLTNQVRSQSGDESRIYSFQAQSRSIIKDNPATYDSHLVAALGINWAHAVTIRLVLEARSGQRFIKLAKSPISPPLAFPFKITSSGVILLDDDGIEMKGPEINTIQCQGDIANIIRFSQLPLDDPSPLDGHPSIILIDPSSWWRYGQGILEYNYSNGCTYIRY
ncbi:DNA repair protein [Vigna angularis]|uniref:DNA repair protein n=1 Tax=Phaseolus angularis TaxID=3914 RepID=A0A8T0JHD2_PHAAN|nr:DNA repair protein [Vigna angularis]